MKTKTIFRTFRDGGDTIALFPEIPADTQGHYCQSYQRFGQHGAASLGEGFMKSTRRATAEDIADLRAELERIGYEVEPVTRVTLNMHRARFAEIAASRECSVSKLLPA